MRIDCRETKVYKVNRCGGGSQFAHIFPTEVSVTSLIAVLDKDKSPVQCINNSG